MSINATCSTIFLATGAEHVEGIQMNAITAARTAQLHQWRVPLTAGPAAAAEARKQVRAAIWAWDVSVDPEVAVLLVCELVTNAITHTASEAVTLAIVAAESGLRVDVHDTSSCLPVMAREGSPEGSIDAISLFSETGRGLQLVAALSDEWGFYRTPAGKAVYFTLGFQPGR
jgi:anti-sigma regulatory factor (Ser/Thr protein kinase)